MKLIQLIDEIETRLRKPTHIENVYENAPPDIQKLCRVLKLAIRELEFYSNEDYYFDYDIASDGTVYKTTTMEMDLGSTAKRVLSEMFEILKTIAHEENNSNTLYDGEEV